MTNQQYSITPPPELVRHWARFQSYTPEALWFCIAHHAAQWGADQELEACCEWFVYDWTDIETADKLRAARRPKPPSLKKQALMALEDGDTGPGASLTSNEVSIIRRALEQLND
jgi:hypothetical protein